MTRPFVIAIDGPAAAGKGTLARSLAERLNLQYLDTGALYRAVGHAVLAAGQDPTDEFAATAAARSLRPETLEIGPHLRTEQVGQAASKVSAIPAVRAALLQFQRDFAATLHAGKRGSVLDGRDIGTVVCPDADVKLYIDADPEVRATRRAREMAAKDPGADVEAIRASIMERDLREATRAVAPMKPAADAVVIDTTALSPEEVLARALAAAATISASAA